MARVTKAGGAVLASLEPDYASRIDYPENPAAPFILKNMEELGADVHTGRKLKYLFVAAGLETEFGMDTQSDYIFITDDRERLERFKKLRWLFEKLLKKNGWTEEELGRYLEKETELLEQALRFSFTPCFYAVGRKT